MQLSSLSDCYLTRKNSSRELFLVKNLYKYWAFANFTEKNSSPLSNLPNNKKKILIYISVQFK